MWLKTQWGNLINLDHYSFFYVNEKRNAVCGRLITEETLLLESSTEGEMYYDNVEKRWKKNTMYDYEFPYNSTAAYGYQDYEIAIFKEPEQAQAYLNKLAEKLGAEVIDIDND